MQNTRTQLLTSSTGTWLAHSRLEEGCAKAPVPTDTAGAQRSDSETFNSTRATPIRHFSHAMTNSSPDGLELTAGPTATTTSLQHGGAAIGGDVGGGGYGHTIPCFHGGSSETLPRRTDHRREPEQPVPGATQRGPPTF